MDLAKGLGDRAQGRSQGMSSQVSDSPHELAPGALSALLDDHAELRDIMAEIRKAADSDILGGLLQRLSGLLHAHFAREEADPGMRRMLALPSNPSDESATPLIEEHGALLSALGDLAAQVEANGQRSAASLGPRRSK